MLSLLFFSNHAHSIFVKIGKMMLMIELICRDFPICARINKEGGKSHFTFPLSGVIFCRALLKPKGERLLRGLIFNPYQSLYCQFPFQVKHLPLFSFSVLYVQLREGFHQYDFENFQQMWKK